MCSWKIKSPAIYTGRNTEICFKHVLSNSYIEQVFNVAVPFYNDILDKCGYYQKLTFDKEQHTHERRNRGRNIIWYQPLFSKNVKTNIAKQFLH